MLLQVFFANRQKHLTFFKRSIFLFALAKAASAAHGALGHSLAHTMNTHHKMIPLRLEFGMTVGTNEGHIHQKDVRTDKHGCHGQGNHVPRDIHGGVKPVDPAGAKSKGDGEKGDGK